MSLPGKRIVQTTFDEVVRENIEDLELDPQEAISDAIEQFSAQVSLFGTKYQIHDTSFLQTS